MNYHGGNIYDYKQKLLDFSANINPLGVPESFRQAVILRMEEFTRYPDIHYTQLRKNIAEYVGLSDIEGVMPGNGAVDLIYKTIQAADRSRVYSIGPTFSEYKRAALCAGKDFEEINPFKAGFQGIDVDFLLAQVKAKSTLILCNPNNPTGTLIDIRQMCYIAGQLMQRGSILVVDEAFMEFTDHYPSNSMIPYLNTMENVVVIKAATKFFGMPGIRLGYGMTFNKQILSGIMANTEPWSINTAAVIAGDSVFKDRDYIDASRAWIANERPYIYDGLKGIKGINVYPSQANFHLVEIGRQDMDAWQLKEALAARGVLIRTPEGFSYLTRYHLRLAVLDHISNTKMLAQLAEIISQ